MIARAGTIAAALLCGSTATLAAQLKTPAHWRWVLDTPARLTTEGKLSDSSWHFAAMPPGWHVTTGPGAVLFDPRYNASGRFALETEIFLFPGASKDGIGVFAGGRELESGRRTWTAFMVRHDGSAAVVAQRGPDRRDLMAWTRHDSIGVQTGEDPIRHVLRIEADSTTVTFRVNGAKVATLPRTEAPMDGTFGFRVGQGVNLHASRLDYIIKLAPVPAPKS